MKDLQFKRIRVTNQLQKSKPEELANLKPTAKMKRGDWMKIKTDVEIKFG